jgi:hypothetical protein
VGRRRPDGRFTRSCQRNRQQLYLEQGGSENVNFLHRARPSDLNGRSESVTPDRISATGGATLSASGQAPTGVAEPGNLISAVEAGTNGSVGSHG